MWGLGHPWPRRQNSEQQVGERQLRYCGNGKRVAAAQVRAHEAKRVVAAQPQRIRSYCTVASSSCVRRAHGPQRGNPAGDMSIRTHGSACAK